MIVIIGRLFWSLVSRPVIPLNILQCTGGSQQQSFIWPYISIMPHTGRMGPVLPPGSPCACGPWVQAPALTQSCGLQTFGIPFFYRLAFSTSLKTLLGQIITHLLSIYSVPALCKELYVSCFTHAAQQPSRVALLLLLLFCR